MLCGSLDRRGVWGRMDTCICMTESLCCPPEFIITLLISYTPIQNLKVQKKKTIPSKHFINAKRSQENDKYNHTDWPLLTNSAITIPDQGILLPWDLLGSISLPLVFLFYESESCSVVSNSLQPHGLVHGILQARILEWVDIPFSRGSSQPWDQTQVSCTAGRFFTSWTTGEALLFYEKVKFYFKLESLKMHL